MRAFFVGVSIVVLLLARSDYAADLGYEIGFRRAAEITSPEEPAKPFSIEFKDRTWALLGVEEIARHHAVADEARLSPPAKDEIDPSKVFEVTFAFGSCDSTKVVIAHPWIGASLWPRTREAFFAASEKKIAMRAVQDDDFAYVF